MAMFDNKTFEVRKDSRFLEMKMEINASKVMKWDDSALMAMEHTKVNEGFLNERAMDVAAVEVADILAHSRVVPVHGRALEGVDMSGRGVRLEHKVAISALEMEMENPAIVKRPHGAEMLAAKIKHTFPLCCNCQHFNTTFNTEEFQEPRYGGSTLRTTVIGRCGIAHEAELTAVFEGRNCPDGYIPALNRWRKPEHRIFSVEVFDKESGMVRVIDEEKPTALSFMEAVRRRPDISFASGPGMKMGIADKDAEMERISQSHPPGNVGRALGEVFYVGPEELKTIKEHTKIKVGRAAERASISATPQSQSDDAW